jgi:enoyl-CoA hydratase/carnithine racemase
MGRPVSDPLLIERGRVATLRLNRPEQRNALNTALIETLIEALGDLGRDPDVAVVRLTAAGERAFCAGADLREVEALGDVAAVRRYFGGMARLLKALWQCPKPVVAVAFGHTLAGGMGLAAGADLLLAADDTSFGLPEMQIGLFPMVVMAPISRILGRRRTLELALSGQRVDAATAERWGFVNRILPAASREEDGRRYCEDLAGKSGLISRLGKLGAGPAWDLDYLAALEWLEEQVSVVALSADSREGIQAFWAKRAPEWLS